MSPERTPIFWLTGRSGAGKTTLVSAVAEKLAAVGKTSRVFDGDDVRREFSKHLGFTPEDIQKNNHLIAELCVQHRCNYDCIFVPVISPFQKVREEVRHLIGDDFYLIYVKASLDEVSKRDVKGLYQKAFAGEISNFIGVDPSVPFEEPPFADLVLDSEKSDVEICTLRFFDFVSSQMR